ncbi:hypothetical protein Tco_0142196, partial [Tanacetum coccineum]
MFSSQIKNVLSYVMQEELLQFKLQDVWVLCDLPEGKRVIGTKWVFRNKRDERVEEDTAHPFFDDIANQDAAVTPDLERKSDETEKVNIEEKEASNVRSGDTEELDLETTQSPSSPLRPIQVMDSEEQLNAAEVLVSISSRPRGLSIPGPIQSQPQQPAQGTDTQGTDTQGTDPKDKGKGILVEEPKKKKLTLQ